MRLQHGMRLLDNGLTGAVAGYSCGMLDAPQVTPGAEHSSVVTWPIISF